MLYIEMIKDSIMSLGKSEHHYLFFLLEGIVCLKNEETGITFVRGMEFILLPSGCKISCEAIERSIYIVVNCVGLQSEGNISYMEALHTYTGGHTYRHSVFPIRHKLEKILRSFAVYDNSLYRYPTVYDTIFVILRAMYSPDEMVSLLSPVGTKDGSE